MVPEREERRGAGNGERKRTKWDLETEGEDPSS